MQFPREEGAKITAGTVIGSLDIQERFGRQLDTLFIPDLDTRQARFISRRFGVGSEHARLVAQLFFGGGAHDA